MATLGTDQRATVAGSQVQQLGMNLRSIRREVKHVKEQKEYYAPPTFGPGKYHSNPTHAYGFQPLQPHPSREGAVVKLPYEIRKVETHGNSY